MVAALCVYKGELLVANNNDRNPAGAEIKGFHSEYSKFFQELAGRGSAGDSAEAMQLAFSDQIDFFAGKTMTAIEARRKENAAAGIDDPDDSGISYETLRARISRVVGAFSQTAQDRFPPEVIKALIGKWRNVSNGKHAEMAIIDFIGEKGVVELKDDLYIAASKLCCYDCSKEITRLNEKLVEPKIARRGTHGTSYPNWVGPFTRTRSRNTNEVFPIDPDKRGGERAGRSPDAPQIRMGAYGAHRAELFEIPIVQKSNKQKGHSSYNAPKQVVAQETAIFSLEEAKSKLDAATQALDTARAILKAKEANETTIREKRDSLMQPKPETVEDLDEEAKAGSKSEQRRAAKQAQEQKRKLQAAEQELQGAQEATKAALSDVATAIVNYREAQMRHERATVPGIESKDDGGDEERKEDGPKSKISRLDAAGGDVREGSSSENNREIPIGIIGEVEQAASDGRLTPPHTPRGPQKKPEKEQGL